jgi:transposase
MIALPPGVRVYLACGITDMRRGMASLAMLVQQELLEVLSTAHFMCSAVAVPG